MDGGFGDYEAPDVERVGAVAGVAGVHFAELGEVVLEVEGVATGAGVKGGFKWDGSLGVGVGRGNKQIQNTRLNY